MKILLINQDWFAPELRAMGHEVHALGSLWKLDSQIRVPLLHIDDIIREIPGGFAPDRIVVHDNSAPVMIAGLEDCAIPMVFLSVDTHHHASQHRYLWHLFDHQFVAQRDYMQQFAAVGATPEWMPLWASRIVTPKEPKEFGAVFVGTLNARLNPDRVAFFDELQRLVPIKVMQGDWAQIFAKSALVVNQTVKGDLNFRVFESMISGAALLTERSGNGLEELFDEGAELYLYKKGNVQQAAEIIRAALDDRARCAQVAEAGRAEVQRTHLPYHRAVRLDEVLAGLQRNQRPLRRFSAMSNYAELARRFRSVDSALFVRSLALALKAAESALNEGEPLTQELGCLALVLSVMYDRVMTSSAGSNLVNALSEEYPTILALRLGKLRGLLNSGHQEQAVEIARTMVTAPETLFRQVDELVISLSQEVWGTE